MSEKLDLIFKELNKKYGAGTVILGTETEENLEVIDSGSISFNRATSVGGYPIGRLIEMFGPQSSGKSTLCLHAIANFQKAGKKVVLCDSEQSFDRTYAEALGVNIATLLIVQPESQEDGYNQVEKLLDSGEIGLIVIDSHTAMIPRKVVDSDVGEATIGLQARINSIAIGKIHPKLRKLGCTMIAISQTRTNIGGYGDTNVATGGKAYQFYSDMRIKVFKATEKDDQQDRTTVEVIKNKVGIPYGKATFVIEWGHGIDKSQEIIDIAIEKGLIKKGGAWFTVDEANKFQGNDKLKGFFLENPEYLLNLEEQIQ